MAAQTETQVVALEIETVDKVVATAFERDDEWLTSIDIDKNVEVVSNRSMRVPLELKPGGNFGHFNPAGGSLGRGSGSTYDKGVIDPVHLKEGWEYHKLVEWSTNSSRKAVQNAVRKQLADALDEFRRMLSCTALTAGNGVVGTITSVATAGGQDTYTCSTDGFDVRLMRHGQFVAVYTSNLGASRVITPGGGGTNDGIAAEIDIHDIPLKQVRIKGTVAAPAVPGDKLVLNGLSGASPISLKGLAYHHDDASTGNWLGIDRALNPEIRATRVTASGPLAFPFPRLVMNKMGKRLGKKFSRKKLNAWMNPCQSAAYEEMGYLVSSIQKQAREEGLNLYFGEDMQMAGCPVKTDFAWDAKRIDFVDSTLWGRAVMKPVGFYEEDGRKLFEVRAADGSVTAAAFYALCTSFNIFHRNPAGGAYISDLTIPAGN